MNRRAVGSIGETAVCRYLEQNGYRILARNFTVRGGEIDIIAVRGACLCFVEVKSRREGSQESGDEAVGSAKMRRMIGAASLYCARCGIDEESIYIRYDIAAVRMRQGEVIDIDYLENAFDESDFSI